MITASGNVLDIEDYTVNRVSWHGSKRSRGTGGAHGSRKCAPSSTAQFAIDAVRRNEILSRLLDPIGPTAWGGREVLWPLWANEMIHRTYVMVQLTASLIADSPSRDASLIGCQLESAVAANLAMGLRGLIIGHDTQPVPCSAPLRSVTRNLVELFGSVAGRVTIDTTIEPLHLPEFKRRALVLLAVDLVSTTLIHGFRRQAGGHINVELRPVTAASARLIVQHNGDGRPQGFPRACDRISWDLANLLEAEMVDGLDGIVGNATRVLFPV